MVSLSGSTGKRERRSRKGVGKRRARNAPSLFAGQGRVEEASSAAFGGLRWVKVVVLGRMWHGDG